MTASTLPAAAWAAATPLRANPTGRVAGIAAAEAQVATDDPFAKALERSRDAARADDARRRNRSPEPQKPETAARPLPPVPAAPPKPSAALPKPAAPKAQTVTQSAHGIELDASDARAHPEGKASPRASAGAEKPRPGDGPESAETEDTTVCHAPDAGPKDANAGTPGGTPLPGALLASSIDPASAAAMAGDPATAGAAAHAVLDSQAQAGAEVASGVPGGAPRRSATAEGRLPGARNAAGLLADGPALQRAGAAAEDARAAGGAQGAHGANGANGTTGTDSGGASSSAAAQLKAAAQDPSTNAGTAALPADAAHAARGDARAADVFTLAPRAATADAPEGLLSARPGTADFAPQLGAQLAVWVRDGVHEARLQLNPADMGPVRVEIQLDGSAAQVSLSAANDQTRQALQDALPGLAGSLREAGFTLAGGGVFDQPPQQRDNDGRKAGDGRLGAAGSDSSSTAGAVAQPLLPRRRGLVDLVA